MHRAKKLLCQFIERLIETITTVLTRKMLVVTENSGKTVETMPSNKTSTNDKKTLLENENTFSNEKNIVKILKNFFLKYYKRH